MWLDCILATPAIGVRFKPNFRLAAKYKEKLAKFLDELAKENRLEAVENLKKNYGLTILEKNGFRYHLDNKEVIVVFSYVMESLEKSGQLPELEENQIRQYQKIMEQSETKINEIFKLLLDGDSTQITRMGFMANTSIDPSNIPPNIEKYLKILKAPWPEKNWFGIDSKNSIELSRNEQVVERCHHHLTKRKTKGKKPESEIFNFSMDWQKLFLEPRNIKNIDDFSGELKISLDSAKKYFSTFGNFGE